MLYQAYQNQSDLMSPFRLLAQSTSAAFWINKTEGSLLRKLSASMEVLSRLRLTHSRPAYNIHSVKVGEQELPVTEEVILTMPFGTLLPTVACSSKATKASERPRRDACCTASGRRSEARERGTRWWNVRGTGPRPV